MFLSRLLETRASPENPSTSLANPDLWLYEALGAEPTSAGVSVNERNARSLSAVFTCIRILSESIAQLPLSIYRKSEDGSEEATEHPLYPILKRRPNELMSAFVWRELAQSQVAGHGNTYHYIERTRRGDVANIWPLPCVGTTPLVRGGNLVYQTVIEGSSVTLPMDDVLHIRGLGGDGLTGWSPIREQREMLGAAMAQQNFSSRFWSNGAHLNGVLEHPGKVPDIDKLRREWNAVYQGVGNALKTAILEKGMTYKAIGIPPEDAQFVETKKLSRLEVASIYRIPPHMIAEMDRATWANVESLGIEFVVHTLGPWFVRWEQELERALLGPRDAITYEIRFDATALLRGDQRSRAQFYTAGITSGWMTRNEARRREGMKSLPGLDEPTKPINMGGDPADQGGDTGDNGDKDDPNNKDDNSKPKDKQKAKRNTVADAAVERVARREAAIIQRLAGKHEGNAFLMEAEKAFRHGVRFTSMVLGVDENDADDYARRQMLALSAAPDVKSAVAAWETTAMLALQELVDGI